MSFKIGDKIIMINDCYPYYQKDYKGYIYEIDLNDPNDAHYRVKFDNGAIFWVLDQDIKLESDHTEDISKIKLGDKVRINGECSNPDWIGLTGIICEKLENDCFKIKLDNPIPNYGYYINLKSFKYTLIDNNQSSNIGPVVTNCSHPSKHKTGFLTQFWVCDVCKKDLGNC